MNSVFDCANHISIINAVSGQVNNFFSKSH